MFNTGVLVALTFLAAAPQAPQPPGASAEVMRRRAQVQMLEGVLARAVRLGAEDLSRRMQSADPSLLMTTGTARARGFILEGYGVFFDVDIPALRPSVVWAFRTMDRELQMGNALETLREFVRSARDPVMRANGEQALKRVELVVGPMQPQREPPPGIVTGASVPEPQPPAGAAAALPLPDDPNTAYTEAVKAALIDAMLDYSAPMDLGADEWLTIAARDSEGPLLPGEIYDAVTIVIRVKGSDIAAYHADRSKRDEIRRRVASEVRMF